MDCWLQWHSATTWYHTTGTEHVQRDDKGCSMHLWQKWLHFTFEKWQWAIIIQFNYSFEFHIKLAQAHTQHTTSHQSAPCGRWKMPWSKWRANHKNECLQVIEKRVWGFYLRTGSPACKIKGCLKEAWSPYCLFFFFLSNTFICIIITQLL